MECILCQGLMVGDQRVGGIIEMGQRMAKGTTH